MNYHQTPEEIINNASPEQRILWNYLFLKFGQNISLSQFVFVGAVIGSPLQTYNARIIYFALSLEFSGSVADNAAGLSTFYDENNAGLFQLKNNSPYWNTTGADVVIHKNNAIAKNIYFSRVLSNYGEMSFLGYRLGI
jgi:hypothetical protein